MVYAELSMTSNHDRLFVSLPEMIYSTTPYGSERGVLGNQHSYRDDEMDWVINTSAIPTKDN
uniref:Uncharacterized protein n=1 Tax=mine drainage metagenome TaxID=410659 RepID=E6QW05_9ZZZZ